MESDHGYDPYGSGRSGDSTPGRGGSVAGDPQLGLREWLSAAPDYAGMADVVETLARLPSPEEVLSLRPSPGLQDRIELLLAKNRYGSLSTAEQTEWDAISILSTWSAWPSARAVQRQAERERA